MIWLSVLDEASSPACLNELKQNKKKTTRKKWRRVSCARDPKFVEFHHFSGHAMYFTWAWTSLFWVLVPNCTCILANSNSTFRLRFLLALFCVQFLLLIACRDVICDIILDFEGSSQVDTEPPGPPPFIFSTMPLRKNNLRDNNIQSIHQ